MQLLFCLFADSVGLLPNRVFRRLIDSDNRFYPAKFMRMLRNLFAAMAERDGIFGEHAIRYFNGGLFKAGDSAIELDKHDLSILHEAATRYNWAHVAPAIFGTLFERSLDPARRSLIGAHYTSEEDIRLLVEPVVMRPLEQRWAHVRASILTALGLPANSEDAANPSPAVILAEGQNLRISPLAPSARNIIAQGNALGQKPATNPRTVGPRYQSKSLLYSNPEAEHLLAAASRPGHIFNLGHGIVPTTPVEAVLSVVRQIKQSNR